MTIFQKDLFKKTLMTILFASIIFFCLVFTIYSYTNNPATIMTVANTLTIISVSTLILNNILGSNKFQEIDDKYENNPLEQVDKTTEDNTAKVMKHDFESYFNLIISRLEKQIMISDDKASTLLDQGIKYSVIGVVVYIVSIIVWQILCIYYNYHEHFLYGMISSSILFIFLESLSAWFLKQYKSFTDTSTYIIKIKSIFDKYALCHFTTKESSSRDVHLDKMLTLLGDEIKWPETYLLKKADIGFAKDAIESMSCAFEAMKSHTKSVCGKDVKKDTNAS